VLQRSEHIRDATEARGPLRSARGLRSYLLEGTALVVGTPTPEYGPQPVRHQRATREKLISPI